VAIRRALPAATVGFCRSCIRFVAARFLLSRVALSMNRQDVRTSPVLLFVIGALVCAVIIADLITPLGLAVWVFYALPLGACLFTRMPMLPLFVTGVATISTALLLVFDPFGGAAVVESWVGLTNRSMYIATLWPVAVMVRQLMLAREATDREAWLRKTQATLLESLQGDLSVVEVAKRALEGSVDALGAQVGAAYVVQSDGTLALTAGRALEGDGTPARFQMGEGLVGSVAAGGPLTVVDDLPEGFMRLETGVGAGPARAVTLAPLRADRKTLAVLALGATRAPGQMDRELLERIAEPAALALRSAQYQARLRELLEESQRQAEELQSQQAELEAQQAELEATNEEMTQTNAMMELQSQELERQRDELAFARDAAERASQYKSEFLANMSHELRTPLNSSLILARLLADNAEGTLNEEQVRSAETIYSAGNDLLVLINDILDLAKIEAGRADLNPEPIELSDLIATLERGFAPVAKQKGLAFRVERAREFAPKLVTDGRRLEQILKNLLSNAFKFTERGGVTLRVAAAGDERVEFAVTDTGIGIAPDQREVIFEAFRQADGTTSRKFGGTGLGLSISRELSRLLGGEVALDSEFGKGSTFTLTLPVQAPIQARPPSATPPAPPVRAARTNGYSSTAPVRIAPKEPMFADDRGGPRQRERLILAVEDDPAFARILLDLAHELGFDCAVAQTAEEGLALAGELQPSGILLDVGLPDASGLSVLERLKRNPATRHIPIHVVSAADNTQTALELGAVGYALKPVAREELAQALKKLEERYERQVRRVLLVEDDPRQQESLKKLLGGQSVELVVAGSLKEALPELERRSFDCMVLDLTLPDGSGYELLEKMAEGMRYSFPPVIVYTGKDLDRADEERLRRYSRSIIVKGARSPERLLDEVTLFLHRVESTLPADQRRMLADVRQRDAAFEQRRILVVEDDVRNVFALSRVLEPRGAKVLIARNGREALETLDREPGIELVLMDLMMPEMDGLTAIREIRKREPLKRLPIIALTAKAMADDREHALGAGANDYMAKPFEVERLVSLCRVWLPR
jgi:signal transduction histidine kinase/DNA-binding response OmpR family regulator